MFKQAKNYFQSDHFICYGRFSIGTPPQFFWLLIDTGIDWRVLIKKYEKKRFWSEMLKKKFLKKENISHLFTEVKKFHKFTSYTQKSDQVCQTKNSQRQIE